MWKDRLTFTQEKGFIMILFKIYSPTPFRSYVLICVELNVGLYGYTAVTQARRKTTYSRPLLKLNQSIRWVLKLWSLSTIFSDYIWLQIELFKMQCSYEQHVKTQTEMEVFLTSQWITSLHLIENGSHGIWLWETGFSKIVRVCVRQRQRQKHYVCVHGRVTAVWLGLLSPLPEDCEIRN